jgi:DinB superfamily
MNNKSIHQQTELILAIVEESFRRRAWHGPNLRGSFRGLSARHAAWRPAPGRHNIWEFVLHAAYWKYAIRRRLTGEKRGSFPLKGSNFFPRPVILTEKAWRDDVRLIGDEHRKLIAVIQHHVPGILSKASPVQRKAVIRMLYGIAFHDVYHAGQIRLLRRIITGKK